MYFVVESFERSPEAALTVHLHVETAGQEKRWNGDKFLSIKFAGNVAEVKSRVEKNPPAARESARGVKTIRPAPG